MDNEVTDIFEELDSWPEQPVITNNPDQPIVETISDNAGNKEGSTNETSGYELQDASHYQYKEGYNWHPEADIAYPAPEYTCYDQSPNPYSHTHMIAHSDNGYPQSNDEYHQTAIGLQPAGSTMDTNPVAITNTDVYGYN